MTINLWLYVLRERWNKAGVLRFCRKVRRESGLPHCRRPARNSGTAGADAQRKERAAALSFLYRSAFLARTQTCD